ncbi:predicted protein [Uncinocarpus reesii 1704]|uniref:Uncharacterized protein n=1 Tax=Uncinocarpus reesii (strain UAMH 1704) TaxID=336963 RepID=C4JZT0_UNCRE|nr:uncharacterized protein UREG_07681 [Uncinocarpus reesii 1704]EEP82816.1 predicted protein [Uncinocarpus reesii 1704]
MPLTFKNRRKKGPPLLPAASLEGLEKFVHPHQQWPADQNDSWKNKPLPELPRRASSEYSRSVRNSDYNFGYGVYGYLSSGLPSPRGHNSPHRSYRDSHHESRARRQTPTANLREKYRRTSGHHGRWVIRQSSSPALSHDHPWAEGGSPPQAEWSSPPVPNASVHGDTVIFEHANASLPEIPTLVPPPSPKTVDSIDASLIPRPLGVDQIQDEDGSEAGKAKEIPSILLVENSDPDICLCHSPHPRHDRVMSVSRLANVARIDLAQQITSPSQESLAIVSPCEAEKLEATVPYSPIDEKGIETVKQVEEAEEIHNEDEGNDEIGKSTENDNSNCTKLYSISTTASTRKLIVEDEEPQDSGISDMEPPRAPYPSPRPSRSSSLPPPNLHPRHPRRQKQIAIPPTDYQKYGPQAWTKDKAKSKPNSKLKPKPKPKEKGKETNKSQDPGDEKGKEKEKNEQKRGISCIPRYFRKLLPKAFSSESAPCPPSPLPPPPPPRPRPESPAFHRTFTAPSAPSFQRQHADSYPHRTQTYPLQAP